MPSNPGLQKASLGVRIFSWGFLIMVLLSVGFVWLDQGLKKNQKENLPSRGAKRALGERSDPQTLKVLGVESPLGQIPEFILTERSEKKVSLGDLRDHVWVANFIFTSCMGPCPMMTMRMAELQDSLKGEHEVRFVSFSVDPATDTPEVLRAYADNYGAEKERWYFLTGDERIIHNISRKGFLLAAKRNTKEQIAAGSDILSHSMRFVLVDRQARIRGYYSGVDPQSLEQLEADVRILLDS